MGWNYQDRVPYYFSLGSAMDYEELFQQEQCALSARRTSLISFEYLVL
jgi:hypothetical protein